MKRTLFPIVSLIIIGITYISLSSLNEAKQTTGDEYFFIKRQLIWLAVGLFAYLFGNTISLQVVKRIDRYLFYLFVFLLVLVLFPKLGVSSLGASRWLNFGFIGIQPTEFFKIVTIIFFSHLFTKNGLCSITNLLVYLVPPIVLILLEPNLSTAILICAIIFSLYYLSNANIVALFSLVTVSLVISLSLIVISPYRQKRLQTLMNPDPKNQQNYHINQIIYAISSGNWIGKGLGNSEQKYSYLPKIASDSIVAIIGEETGFLGITGIISLYLLLVISLLKTAQQITDHFGSLLISGVALWIAYQCLINLAAITALIPLTGVPLPFISYGGSSLISLLFALGLVNNVYRSHLIYLDSHKYAKDHNHHRQPSHPSHRTN